MTGCLIDDDQEGRGEAGHQERRRGQADQTHPRLERSVEGGVHESAPGEAGEGERSPYLLAEEPDGRHEQWPGAEPGDRPERQRHEAEDHRLSDHQTDVGAVADGPHPPDQRSEVGQAPQRAQGEHTEAPQVRDALQHPEEDGDPDQHRVRKGQRLERERGEDAGEDDEERSEPEGHGGAGQSSTTSWRSVSLRTSSPSSVQTAMSSIRAPKRPGW